MFFCPVADIWIQWRYIAEYFIQTRPLTINQIASLPVFYCITLHSQLLSLLYLCIKFFG